MAKKDIKVKIDKEEVKKKGGKFFGEFKEFISRGDVVDLAVGVIIGGAFGKIVTSLVDNILMPLIGLIIGGIDFSDLSIKVKDATVAYGLFIQNVIDFLIVAFCIFLFVKAINKVSRKEKEEKEAEVEETVEEVVASSEDQRNEQIALLKEIRDLLKKESK